MVLKIISSVVAGVILLVLIMYGIFVYPKISHTFNVDFSDETIWEIPKKLSAPVYFKKYDFGYFKALLPKLDSCSIKEELKTPTSLYESFTYKYTINGAQAFELIVYEPPITEAKFNYTTEYLREYPGFKKSLEDVYYDFSSHKTFKDYKYNPFYLRLKGDLIKGETNCFNHKFLNIKFGDHYGIAYRWETEKGESAHIELMVNDYIIEFRVTAKPALFKLTDILPIILSNISEFQLEKGFYNPLEN